MENFAAVRTLIESIRVDDDVTRVRASIALSLAAKLDEALASDAAGSFIAAPQLSKELDRLIEEIKGAQAEETSLVDSLFVRE